jgi:hypothetical protein
MRILLYTGHNLQLFHLLQAGREITCLFNDYKVKYRARCGFFPGLLRNAVINIYLQTVQ